jgi:hypothetical protein
MTRKEAADASHISQGEADFEFLSAKTRAVLDSQDEKN